MTAAQISKMKPKQFNDPNYTKLVQLMKKKQLISRRNEFLKIKLSDPGELLHLMRHLHEIDGVKVQVRINSYLQEVTGACISFLIEESQRVPEAVVRVIGTRILTSRIIFEDDNDFIKKLRNIARPLLLRKCFVDKLLLETLEINLALSWSADFNNCVIFPIYHPYNKKVIFYSVLVNYDNTTHSLDYYHSLVGECFRYCQEIVLNSTRYSEEKYFHLKYKEILSFNLRNIKCIDHLPSLIAGIRSMLLQIFGAERCFMFIVEGKRICTRISEYGQAFDMAEEPVRDIKIPFGTGLAGTVAESGKIINCRDPDNDCMYRRDLEIASRKKSRNVLTFPILLYKGVFGVVQMHDKINARHFDSADVLFARFLGPAIGIQLHICLRKKKIWDAINRRSMLEELFFRDSKVIEGEEVNSVVNCTRKHEYVDFLNYKFLPADVEAEDHLCLCLKIFEEFGILSQFSIDRRHFIKFLINIRTRHSTYPLHNWRHSFCVFHFLYAVIKNENLLDTRIIREIELFAMLLATLSHAMEFRGSTTPYQPTTGSVLASLYSTAGSLLQFYSTVQIIRLLASRECPITEALEPEEYRELIKKIDQIFLYMDLAYHISNKENISKIGQTYDRNNPDHNMALHSVVMICSELSDYCKPFDYCNTFSDGTLEEFYSPDMKDCTGVIDISGFIENVQLKKVDLQIHFLKHVCQELFLMLKLFLPGTSLCYDQVEENCRKFSVKREEVIQQQMEM